ncbi:MAG: site-2 protease family protein, partial [Actinomycetota bacterium]|nr:site-2 protease family protein [Actinomycetota bacterium]
MAGNLHSPVGRGAPPLAGLLLGRLRGVPVLLAPSWWVGAVVVTALYAPVVTRLLPEVGDGSVVLLAATLAALLGLSVLLHELGHCVVALRLGVPVLRVRLFLLGGISELARRPAGPRDEGLIAAAGPAVSVVLAVLAGAGWWVLEPGGVLWLLVAEVAVANAAVGAFNLLPGLPLDGGRVLRSLVWAITGRRRTGTTAAVAGAGVVAFGLLVWAVSGLL